MNILRILKLPLSLGFIAPLAWAASDPVLPKLHREFASEIEKAASLVENPNALTGADRFRLAFAMHYTATREQIGRVLFVMDSQAEVLESIIQKSLKNPLPIDPPKNQTLIDLGLEGAKLKMRIACPDCGAVLDDFFKIFDIRDAHDGFSGLPFYSLVQNRFSEKRFQDEVLSLRDGLLETLKNLEKNPDASLSKDLWTLALESTKGDRGRAIELLGIVTSRDVLITRYLRYLRTDNLEFIRAFGMAPIQIRLIGDLTKEYAGHGLDLFSFPKETYLSGLQKNYYFWSSALVSHRLKLLGHPDDKIEKLALEFPRQYKTLRFLSAGGPLKPVAYKNERLSDAKRVIHASGAGSVYSLKQGPTPSEKGSTELEAFLQASSDKRDAAFLSKAELLRRAESPEGKNRLYLYFYDFGDSRIGMSHIKLGLQGEVFEIHRFKNTNDTFLRQRPFITALRDARSGALPSGILEIPVTPEQVEAITHFLEVESDASMKYSFFNHLFNSESYNCGGILYDALRNAGFPLSKLERQKFFAGSIFKKMATELPVIATAGKAKNLSENLITTPNINQATFSPGGLEPNKTFAKRVGYEYLQAEQKFSERTPLFSNPRKAIGFFVKTYSNTGDLPDTYKPEKGNLLDIPTALIPEEEIGAYFSADGVSPENLSRIKINLEGKIYYRLFIHPEEVEHYTEMRNLGPPDPIEWIGTPSSSARTYFIADGAGKSPPFAVKMSLSVVMGGGSRINTPDKVARSIAVNNMIKSIYESSGGKIHGSDKTWTYLPEESALLPKKQELGGIIIRDLPNGFSSKIHLPWFALMADRKGQELWVDELYRYSGYKNRLEFAWKELVKPVVEIHSMLSMDYGLTTELHQQNLIVQIDPITRKIDGLVLKDMDGNWVDYSLRRKIFNDLPELTESSREEARLFRYAEAQGNQIFSYRNIIRQRTIEGTFKYFLNAQETTELLYLADQTLVRRFNTRFGDLAKASDLETLEKAWDELHAKVTTPAEKRLYASIMESGVSQKSTYVQFTQRLEKSYYRLQKWMTKQIPKRTIRAHCVELLGSD